jgi:hypothetical protein
MQEWSSRLGPGSPLESVVSRSAKTASRQPVPLPGPLLSARERPWPIVGREAELAEIAAAWARATDGSGETVLVAGEPGAGKSRLIAEAAGAAHAEGALVLYGSGEGATDTPYAPFVAALGDLDRHGTEPLRGERRRAPRAPSTPWPRSPPERPSGAWVTTGPSCSRRLWSCSNASPATARC